MTPLQLLLVSLIVFLYSFLIIKPNKETSKLYLIAQAFGEISLVSIFISLIWCIFYYIKF